MFFVDDLVNAVINSYNLDNQNFEGNDRESEDNLSLVFLKEKRKYFFIVIEEFIDIISISCDKVIEKFKMKGKVLDYLIIYRVFD